MKTQDLAGKKFGKLTAIERDGSDNSGRAVWICQCDCGNVTRVNSNNLKFTVNSCGCSRRSPRITT